MLDESSNLRDYKLFLLWFFLCSSIFVLCFSIFAPSLKRGKTMYAQNKRGVYAENNECGIRKLFSMTVQEWYNIYQTLCLRLQESFYIFKSRFILCVIYRKKSHKFYKDAADCNLEWPHHEQLTCDRHVRTPYVNRRYADVEKCRDQKPMLSRRHFYDVWSTCAIRRCTDVGFRSPTSQPIYNQR